MLGLSCTMMVDDDDKEEEEQLKDNDDGGYGEMKRRGWGGQR